MHVNLFYPASEDKCTRRQSVPMSDPCAMLPVVQGHSLINGGTKKVQN